MDGSTTYSVSCARLALGWQTGYFPVWEIWSFYALPSVFSIEKESRKSWIQLHDEYEHENSCDRHTDTKLDTLQQSEDSTSSKENGCLRLVLIKLASAGQCNLNRI